MAVAPWIVSDELWERVEPLLPKTQRRFQVLVATLGAQLPFVVLEPLNEVCDGHTSSVGRRT